jgi:tRNA(fMet)-specific endonuclease VapC
VTVDDPNVVVVDTDVFSYIFLQSPKAGLYVPHLEDHLPALSFQTVAELYQGAFQRGWGERRLGQLAAELRKYVVLPFQMEMAQQWARVRSDGKSSGHPIEAPDAWIAATALWAGCPLITHNRRDFEHIEGLTVISES